MSRIKLGCSYELGSGRTRIRVLTRPRKRLGTVMTKSHWGVEKSHCSIRKSHHGVEISHLIVEKSHPIVKKSLCGVENSHHSLEISILQWRLPNVKSPFQISLLTLQVLHVPYDTVFMFTKGKLFSFCYTDSHDSIGFFSFFIQYTHSTQSVSPSLYW